MFNAHVIIREAKRLECLEKAHFILVWSISTVYLGSALLRQIHIHVQSSMPPSDRSAQSLLLRQFQHEFAIQSLMLLEEEERSNSVGPES